MQGQLRLEDVLEDETYLDRPIIGRDSPINGGIYLGGNTREAIVVDYQNSSQLRLAYRQAKEMATDNSGKVKRGKVLQAVYDLTKDKIEFSGDEVDLIIKNNSVGKDGKISLGIFLQEGYGVCRHMALLSALLLEKFVDEGHIRGKPSVDRNSCFHSAHAWCRYTNYSGTVYIIDPAKNFLGTLQNSKEKMVWEYFRDNDKVKLPSKSS